MTSTKNRKKGEKTQISWMVKRERGGREDQEKVKREQKQKILL